MSNQKENFEIRKWFGHTRGNLIKNIRMKIEADPASMFRVASFLMSVGVSLEDANVFALELARKIAYLEPKKLILTKDGEVETHIDVCQN